MGEHLILRERLLDEEQVELVELRKMLRVRQLIGGVGVDLQRNIAESVSHGPHRLDVPARLDLELDTAIAGIEVAAHGCQQLRDRAVDSNRDPAVHGGTNRAEVMRKRLAGGTQLGVEHRHLDRRLRHQMTADRTQHIRHVRGGKALPLEQPWQQVMDKHVLRALHVLGRVVRLIAGHALAPALPLVGDGLDQEDVALELGSESSLDRRHEGDPYAPQLGGFELHESTG